MLLGPIKLRMGPNELVGRDEELQGLLPALREDKLVSIWGGAGEGKSRLAYELVDRLHGRDGVWFDRIIIAELGARRHAFTFQRVWGISRALTK